MLDIGLRSMSFDASLIEDSENGPFDVAVRSEQPFKNPIMV